MFVVYFKPISLNALQRAKGLFEGHEVYLGLHELRLDHAACY